MSKVTRVTVPNLVTPLPNLVRPLPNLVKSGHTLCEHQKPAPSEIDSERGVTFGFGDKRRLFFSLKKSALLFFLQPEIHVGGQV
jgi:hypothetical protein